MMREQLKYFLCKWELQGKKKYRLILAKNKKDAKEVFRDNFYKVGSIKIYDTITPKTK